MRGPRWGAVKSGYRRSLAALSKMQDIVISTFTFDDRVNPHINFKTPIEAVNAITKLPFTGRGTNYRKALEIVVSLIEKRDPKFKDYLTCIFFLSDGEGGYPDKAIKTLKEMKASGYKILFNTIACATDEEKEMVQMAKEVNGEHYKIINQKASEAVFLKILGITG